MSTFNATLVLPTKTLFKNVNGEPVYLEWDKVPATVLAEILVGGGQIILNNAYNGSGKDAKDADRLANAMKRWDSWVRGSYRITERSAAQSTLMREAYVAEMLAKHDTSEKAVLDLMKKTVKATLGDDTNATFDNFLEALAVQMERNGKGKRDVLKAALVAKYEKAAAEIEAQRQRNAASVDIDLTDLDLDLG